MRRYLLIGLVCLLLFGASVFAERVELKGYSEDINVFVDESSADKIVVRLEVGAFETTEIDINGEQYFNISSGGESVMLEKGAPALPRVSRSVIIPDNARMEMRVVEVKYVDFPQTPVAPSKGNLTRNINPEDVSFEFGSVYSETGFYPSVEADFREPYIMRDFRGTVIDFYPFQYDPGTQTLRAYSSIIVELTVAGEGEINVLDRSNPVSPDFELIYERRFINYPESLDRYTSVGEIGDMLIITYDDFHDEMMPLVNWKNQKGIKTTIVDISTVGNNATSMTNYIQDFYDSTNLAFVLLVGDYAQVTTGSHSCSNGTGGADPKFSLTSGTDSYPDIFVGRFSAETGAHVITQVERVLTYEQTPVAGDWFHRATGVASNEGPGHDGGEYDDVHMGYIRDDLLAYNYTHVDEIYAPSATSSQVSTALNAGRGFLNYVGHGSTTAWSTTGFSNTHVNALTNDNMLPFIISVACVNGKFRFATCFGEAWMRATHNGAPTGAIGVYMSSINQSWNPPMDAEDEVTDLLCAEAKTTYGGLCYNGSCKMMDDNPGSTGYDMFYTWHIFGDPSLQVRSNTPAMLTVNHAGAVFFNSPSYEVEVVGVQGALCALSKDGVLYGSAYTGVDGLASITLTEMLPISVDPMILTVTAYNGETVEADVIVSTDLTILHEPLSDTKEIVADYEVGCLIYSDTTVITDSVLIWYGIDDVWTTAQMSVVRMGDDYIGYIPVQAPGTEISYYLWAKNDAGYIDSTETFSFRVIDYGLLVGPEGLSLTAPVDDTIWYDLYVTNDGVLDDYYDLTISGNVWITALYDASGTTEISASSTIMANETFDFKLMVVVPSSFEDETDQALVTVTSAGDPAYTDAVSVTSISAGQPWPLPFFDDFPNLTFDATKWDQWPGAELSLFGQNLPSPPYSVNLDGSPGGADTIVTEAINLRDENNILLKYYYQRTGGGDSPESGDDLFVEYLDSLGNWLLLTTHTGAGDDMTEFDLVETRLPLPAYHAGFRVRFRNIATSGDNDDWFIDDVFVGYPPDYDLDMEPLSQYQSGPAGYVTSYLVTIINSGRYDGAYDLSVSLNEWTVTFFEESGVTEIFSTPTVSAGDSVAIMVSVAVPSEAVPHLIDTALVKAVSQADAGVWADVSLTTESGGLPIAFPMYEPFDATQLSLDRWFWNIGANVSSNCIAPPSAPYALCLDGGNDTVVSRLIDMSDQDGAILSYYYQAGGASDVPETGENLVFEYKNNVGAWAEVSAQYGDGETMTSFIYVNIPLPIDATHAGFQLRVSSNGGGAGTDEWFMDDVRIDYAPSIAVVPGNLEPTLAPGDSTVVPVIIQNAGPGALRYNVAINQSLFREGFDGGLAVSEDSEPASRTYPAEFFADYIDEKGVDIPNRGFPVTRNSGGPDNYGYLWVDSDDPFGPTFDWVDISATGLDVIDSLDDDSYTGPYDIGFDFSFYGGTYNQLYISSNGLIGFDSTGLSTRYKVPIPTSSTPNNFIAWLWDDFNPLDADNLSAHVYLHSDGEQMVIQFVDYPEYLAEPGEVITAQVILSSDGSIKMQYLTIDPGFDVASGTVGIENAVGDDGLEVAFATSYLKDSLAVMFVKPYEWITVDNMSGNIAPGEADTVNCKIMAGELEDGTYEATVTITSNDPDPGDNPITLPVALTVTTGPIYVCGDINGDGSGPDMVDLIHMVTFMFQSGPPPVVMEAADINGDGGGPDMTDLIYLVAYMFQGGADPICGY